MKSPTLLLLNTESSKKTMANKMRLHHKLPTKVPKWLDSRKDNPSSRNRRPKYRNLNQIILPRDRAAAKNNMREVTITINNNQKKGSIHPLKKLTMARVKNQV